ncbi:MobF family relaxase [Kocuria sp. 2SI]|uniref:MobF family relaxase n=1 Tax=Kocuria sp. 2SI TaxID=2502203 RepID=UPI00201DA4C5|nr:MobF family relaxase [Kocuria sp. 2SI]
MVMTIRVMSAGRGYEYLMKSVATGDATRETGTPLTRYYTETGCPPGTWLGSGLESLDTGRGPALADGDTVTEEQLEKLLGQGVHPLTGAKLGSRFPRLRPPAERIAARIEQLDASLDGMQRQNAIDEIRDEELARKPKTAVAGFDLTFSPMKSLSALWGVADSATQELIVQAHHAAMRDTLALLEQRVAATRVGKGGIARMPITGVIATAFDHYDSRASDPQLHTHLVVSNKVQGIDGRWRTLDSRTLHRATVALSASYNAFLTDHTAVLLGVNWVSVDRGKDRTIGWEIDGVPAGLIEEFSRRTTGGSGEGIAAATKRLIEEYVAKHGHAPSKTTITRLRQQATLETRPEKELHSLAELTADWRDRATGLLGEDATTWAQQVLARGLAEAPLQAGDLATKQLAEIVDVVVREVADRRATWARWHVHAEAMRQLMGVRFTTTAERTAVLDQIIEQAESASVRLTPAYDRAVSEEYVQADGSNRFQGADQVMMTSQDILDAEARLLEHGKAKNGPRLPDRLVKRHVSRKVKGVRLAPDQAAAITAIATSGRSLDLLVGPAGAGKTTALRGLHRAWTAQYGKDSVIGLAPSATAAEILGESLGVTAENVPKFLYEHDKGRWDLRAGQLVIVDEASLAGTLTLDRLTTHAAETGAKIVLVGDWAQLSSVETGGAFGMLVRARRNAPELFTVRRFVHDWEKTASRNLRHGKRAVLDTYETERRLHDGDLDAMLDAVYTAWQHDRDAGLSTLMLAGNAEMVAELNHRARADLVAAHRVHETGVALHDGTTAGVGDLVVTRRNKRRLTTGKSWVKNGDRWQVTAHRDDGALEVRRLGKGDRPRGKRLVLPAAYVREDLELGYASTVHRAQGSTVETAHTLVDPDTASRELLYVALTRGMRENHAYIIQPDPHEVEPHLDPPEELTRFEQLARVLARSDADLSATETRQVEADKHASLATLLDEYDLLAREAQTERWEALLDVAPFATAEIADDVFTSPYYEYLEAALARHEATGHDVTAALTAIAPEIPPADDRTDPAAELAAWLDRATLNQAVRRSANRRRVAGLIPTPPGPIAEDVRAALAERRDLIEAAVDRLLHRAISEGEPWTKGLGTPDADPRARALWTKNATTVALYRHRHGITDPKPVGESKKISSAQQAVEYRYASAALRGARAAQAYPTDFAPHRDGPQHRPGRTL